MTHYNAADLPNLSGKELERIARVINPGGWHVDDKHHPISTLLGSCVAVCLFDPVLKSGGMNHFMLPKMSRSKKADEEDVTLAGDYAMEVLVTALFKKGAQRHRLIAKAFGGGNIVNSITTAIGTRNVEFALHWLQNERITVAAQDFGGPWSRKVIFLPGSGDAFCRRMPINQNIVQETLAKEIAYEKSLHKPKVPAYEGKKIELF
jgi:chemotaxis protein CheD